MSQQASQPFPVLPRVWEGERARVLSLPSIVGRGLAWLVREKR